MLDRKAVKRLKTEHGANEEELVTLNELDSYENACSVLTYSRVTGFSLETITKLMLME